MRVSLNWAQEFSNVDLKQLSTDELVKLATERLGGIEGVIDLSKQYDGILVAKIVSCQKHPNADKLSLCKIDDGGVEKNVERDENGFVQVVCGAPNVKEGLLVAWIPPAAVVPASYGEKELFVLEARDLRGELSNGMLASPAELGINDDHNGILEIDLDAVIPAKAGNQTDGLDSRLRGNDEAVRPGTPFKNLYGLDDTILEIENKMFTHRPDGFGQLGVARELAGIQGLKFESPDWYSNAVIPAKAGISSGDDKDSRLRGNDNLSVAVQDSDLCPRYMAVVIEDVEVKPSPIWLQSHLKRVGVRPINNVVDITNYMMMLTAQPLHAFDFDKLAGKARHPEPVEGSTQISPQGRDDKHVSIIVRRPKKGERMTLLDGKTIQPHEDAILIADQNGPIALGGVMGGGNSEVDDKTKRVVLECATFDMYNIRKTSMIHGIFTDAVTRFNKGQPAEQCDPVLHKATQMFEELTGGKVVGQPVDNYYESKLNKPVSVSVDFINKRLGSSFTAKEIIELLTNVEFTVFSGVIPDSDRESSKNMDSRIKSENDNLSVLAPFWRTDIEIAEDIVEEVGRLYGFNQLPIELPKRTIAPAVPQPQLALKQCVREILARAGANEVLSYSFVHGDLLKKVGQDPKDSYAIRNALSPDLQYYRQTMTPSLLDLVHSNIKAGFDEFALFELNKTHNKIHGNNEEGLPGELNMIALTYASKSGKDAPYYHARKYLDYLAGQLGVSLSYAPIKDALDYPVTKPFNLERSALVTIKEADVFLGIVGEYTPSAIKNFKLPAAAGFEIGLDHIIEALEKVDASHYKPKSKYPSTSQDITIKVSASTPFDAVVACFEEVLQKTDYQWGLMPLSVYQKESEHKNISFRLTLSHYERTLTTPEVNKLVEQLSYFIHEKTGGEQV